MFFPTLLKTTGYFKKILTIVKSMHSSLSSEYKIIVQDSSPENTEEFINKINMAAVK